MKNIFNRESLHKCLFVFSALFLAVSFMASTAFAAGNVAVTRATPDPLSENKSWFFFDYEEAEDEEGNVIEDAVLIKNFGREEVTVELYAVDATSNDAGSFILKFPGDEQLGIGKWTHVEKSAVKLEPGASEVVEFSLQVPEGVEPGQYFGGVVVQEVGPEFEGKAEADEGLIGASVNTRVGSRIYLTVPGDIVTDFAWQDFSHSLSEGADGRYFHFNFENKGNVSIVPEVELKFINMFGRQVAEQRAELGAALPGTKIEPVLEWEDVPFFGKYTVEADLAYYRQDEGRAEKSAVKILNKRLQLWIVPWFELSLLLILLIGVFGALFWKSFSYRRLKENSEWYTVQEGDNVNDLAKEHGVSWRALVKLNDLEAPYVLEEGRRILLPKK